MSSKKLFENEDIKFQNSEPMTVEEIKRPPVATYRYFKENTPELVILTFLPLLKKRKRK